MSAKRIIGVWQGKETKKYWISDEGMGKKQHFVFCHFFFEIESY
jgi:hypothetical protein